jgi:hypothetical protein
MRRQRCYVEVLGRAVLSTLKLWGRAGALQLTIPRLRTVPKARPPEKLSPFTDRLKATTRTILERDSGRHWLRWLRTGEGPMMWSGDEAMDVLRVALAAYSSSASGGAGVDPASLQ